MSPRCTLSALFALPLLALGCAKASPRPPVPPEADRLDAPCPPPAVFERGEPRPRWVRLDNRTADTLTIFVESCWRHTRVVLDLAPGGRRLARLPDALFLHAEGLRFHAYDSGGIHHGVWAVPVAPAIELELVLSAESRLDPSTLDPFGVTAGDDGGGGTGRIAVAAGDEGEYAAVFASGSPAILTWSCSRRGRHLTLSTAERGLSPPLAVRVRFQGPSGGPLATGATPHAGGPEAFPATGAAWRDAGPWVLARGWTDSIVAPATEVLALAAGAPGAEVLELFFEDGEGRRAAHRFLLAGLGEALAGLSCFDGVAAPPAPSGGD